MDESQFHTGSNCKLFSLIFFPTDSIVDPFHLVLGATQPMKQILPLPVVYNIIFNSFGARREERRGKQEGKFLPMRVD